MSDGRTRIESLPAFRDARGTLFEPLDDQGLAAQKNVHVVLSEPGAGAGGSGDLGPDALDLRIGRRQAHLEARFLARFARERDLAADIMDMPSYE